MFKNTLTAFAVFGAILVTNAAIVKDAKSHCVELNEGVPEREKHSYLYGAYHNQKCRLSCEYTYRDYVRRCMLGGYVKLTLVCISGAQAH